MTTRITRRSLLAGAPALALPLFGCRSSDAPPVMAPRDVRPVLGIVPGMPVSDGAGVQLSRSLGSPGLPLLDPFLMLDEIRTDQPDDYLKGFPDHPHRGFETVTYMIDGAMEHKDSVGNRGLLSSGSAQWMTAGKGIIHSELPRQERGLLWGFQLWVNLPRKLKLTPPRYQDIAPASIPELDERGAKVRLIAGALQGALGPVSGIATAPVMLDVALPRAGSFQHELPASYNAFAYVLEGTAKMGAEGAEVRRGELAVFGAGSSVLVHAAEGARFLCLGGEPIGEPVARRGPFVMNTEAELDEAFADYRAGRLTG